MDWLKLVESTQHCQRNWDFEKTIPDGTIDWLFDIGYAMPTKQNQPSVQIVAFKSRSSISLMSEMAYEPKNESPNSGKINNPQTNAPLLFAFIKRKDLLLHSSGSTIDTEIGLTSGAIALAANSIGLKTGFCACINDKGDISKKLKKLLSSKNIKIKEIRLLLGVGYPKEGWPSNQSESTMFPSYSKDANKHYPNFLPDIEKKIIL